MSWRLLLGALLCVLAWQSTALAEERHAVVIGNNRGEAGELPLRYAEVDAEKMAGVLLDVGGVAAENLVLLQGAEVEAVRRALVAVNERIRSGRPEDAVLIVYYSGHADENALHLGETALGLEELRGLVQGSAAAFRLLMVDACRSGGLTQVKGGRMVPPSTIFFRDDLVGQGMVYLSATAADEDAQESEEIRGSFFTHYLVTGLLGAADVDEDGAVDLNEAYRFAYDNTLRASSRSLGGSQHPTFRQDIKGKGDIVLTRWSAPGDRAFIRFPPSESWLVIRDSEGGAIIAEVDAQGRQRTISVRPGQYFVRGRGTEALLEGTVQAQPGSTTDVAEVPLERTAYARLVRKGGSQAPKVIHGLQVGYRLRSGLEANSTVCQGMFGGYSVDLHAVTLIGRIGFCHGRFEIDRADGKSREIDFELRVHKPIDVRWLTIDLGLGVALSLLRQELREPQLGGALPFDETRDSFAFHGDLTLGLQYDFGPGFYIGVEGAAMLYLFEREQTDRSAELEAVFAARLGAIVGVRF